MKILLAVDDNRESYRAALAVSDWFPRGAQVVALHVGPVPETEVRTPVGGYAGTYPMVDVRTGEVSDDTINEGLETARRAAAMARGEARSEDGDPAPTIARVAEEIDADLIVVGTGDRTWLSRLIAPSVSEKVVSTAPCSVLVVRS
jgi:nucleotide-binding universal stress UspA family protein